ncbi:MAG: hypothetical protein HKN94_17175 [Acidimicrobiales bacterium]|nr:hypothetical protein [Acidimicrobiales bacterium]RZV48533.1 MAG: hypothetical protein EX269_01295 [Acidimicrobiales bacterium]
MTPEELCTTTAAPIGTIGAHFYFQPETLAAGKEIGLDGFRFYILGRGGVMGDVDNAVVQSAFGYFDPALIERMWDSARERVPAREAAAAYLEASYTVARSTVAASPTLEAFVDAAAKVVANVDRSGLPLFAGYASMPVPDDTVAAAYHYAVLLRELRGSVHLASVAAAGLHSRVAHQMRRPDMVEFFGWTEELDVVDEHHDRRARADEMTDDAMTQIYSVLSADEAAAFAVGVEEMAQALEVT